MRVRTGSRSPNRVAAALTGDSLWTATGFGVQVAGQVFRAILLARLLSPADLGRFLVLRSVVGAVAVLAQNGLGPVGMRRLAASGESDHPPGGVVRAAGELTALASVACAVAVALVVHAVGYGPVVAASSGVMVCTGAALGVLAGLGRGLGRLRLVVAIDRGLAPALDVVVLAALLLTGATSTLAGVLAPIAAVGLVPPLLLVVVVVRAMRHATDATRPSRRALLSDGWPVTAHGLLARALAEADLWVVGALAGPAAAGLYGIASRVATALQVPLAIGAYAMAPAVARLHAAGDRPSLERYLRTGARWMGATAGAGLATLAVFGLTGLEWLFGPPYVAALPLLLILGAGQVVNAASGIGATTLLMVGRERVLLVISLTAAAVTVVGSLTLVPLVGAFGAAIAAAAAVVVLNVLLIRAVRRYAGVRVHV